MARIPKQERIDREVLERLIIAAAPEKEIELSAFLKRYEPSLFLREDTAGVNLKAGKEYVAFDHKTMRHEWLMSYAAWAAFRCYSPFIVLALSFSTTLTAHTFQDDPELAAEEQRVDDLLYTAAAIRAAPDSADVAWPDGVPEPQADRPPQDIQDRAIFEILCIGTAASFLHELGHVEFAQSQNRPSDAKSEETFCDEFALEHLTSKAEGWAKSVSQPAHQVLAKRAMGLAIAAFAIHHQTPPADQAGSDSHPSSADRFGALFANIPLPEHSIAWTFASALLISVLRQRKRMPKKINFRSAKNLFEKLLKSLK